VFLKVPVLVTRRSVRRDPSGPPCERNYEYLINKRWVNQQEYEQFKLQFIPIVVDQ